jgi:hypothetical protein
VITNAPSAKILMIQYFLQLIKINPTALSGGEKVINKPMVRRLMSLITELRVHPESSHADGMVRFYRVIN